MPYHDFYNDLSIARRPLIVAFSAGHQRIWLLSYFICAGHSALLARLADSMDWARSSECVRRELRASQFLTAIARDRPREDDDCSSVRCFCFPLYLVRIPCSVIMKYFLMSYACTMYRIRMVLWVMRCHAIDRAGCRHGLPLYVSCSSSKDT